MYAEPRGLDRAELTRILSDRWRIDVAEIRYEPVGFGTHHYVTNDAGGVRWWVNVDDLPTKSWLGPDADTAFAELERCLATTVSLRELGLEFVHAPRRTSQDDVLTRMSDRYAVSVYPFVEGRSSEYGEHTSDTERRLVFAALERMHATDKTRLPLPRRDALQVPGRASFLEALDDLGSHWDTGPYGEPARALLRERGGTAMALLDRYDILERAVREDDRNWVVTHGEPHAANVIWTNETTFALIDWDTVAVAPPERDLWMLGSLDDVSVNETAIELFELWWRLSEVTGYTDVFRRPHADDANTKLAWKGLREYLSDS